MFEDFGKMLANIGQNVMKKTGEVTEIAALHTKVLGKKKKIDDEYRALGKAYYEAHKDEITEFASRVEAINSLYTEVAALEEEIKALKEKLPEDQKEAEEVVSEEDFVEEAEEVVENVEEAAEEVVEAVEEAAEEVAEAVEEAVEEVVEEA